MKTMPKSEDEWKKKLSADEYHVLRENGTEMPGTGKSLHNKQTGKYLCQGCGAELFSSDHKFDSGTGWPSFTDATENVGEREDRSHGMVRTEVYCKKCGGHLGHLFKDGPFPGGNRYCINSCSLGFKDKK